jgi:hypothetical protein
MNENQKPSILTKEGAEKATSPKEQAADNSYHIKTNAETPEMALLPGGLFVVSIPLQSKIVSRPLAMGWIIMALFRLHETYNNLEELAEKHRKKIVAPVPGVMDKLKAAASGLIRPS